MKGAWKHLDGGVMLFVPAADPELAKTQDTLSRLSLADDEAQGTLNANHTPCVKDAALPSIEDLLHIIVEDDSEDENLVFTPDSCTLAAESEDKNENPAPSPSSMPSRRILTANTILHNDLYNQLRSFAPNSDVSLEEELAASSELSSVNYDSDKTDFLQISNTPCPQRTTTNRPRQTRLESHHYRVPTTKPVRRTLDFGRAKSRVEKQTPKKSCNTTRPEYEPRHSWSLQEITLVCVLWRFYSRAPHDFTDVFNKIFGLGLKMSKVRNHFETYIRYYGGEAFPVFAEVNSVPVDDPQGIYQEWRDVIELAAKALEIKLHRRQEEDEEISISGRGAYAQAESTQRIFQSLVQTANGEKMRQQHVSGKGPPNEKQQKTVTTKRGLVRNKPKELIKYSPTLSKGVPALGLRVWDCESRTRFDERGFVSELFCQWTGPHIEPFSESQGQHAFLLLANSHMSLRGNASAFVSLGTSLIQLLVRASKMKRPHMAIVDLRHELLNEPNKMHYASDVVRFLKANKLAPYAYKARAEYIVFADVPQDAILYHFPLSNLISLYDEDKSCADILDLEIFKPGQNTPAVALHFRKKRTTLNNDTAKALGRISKTFGLDGERISTEHIACFVARLIDGFYVRTPTMDIQTKSALATTFAEALDSRSCRIRIQDVMSAFMDGIEEGTKMIAYHTSRRS